MNDVVLYTFSSYHKRYKTINRIFLFIMSTYQNLFLLANMKEVYDLLYNNEIPPLYNCTPFFATRIAVRHIINKNKTPNRHGHGRGHRHRIQIWKTNTFFDYWYTDFHHCSKNLIAVMDFSLHDDVQEEDTTIKIERIYVNDGSNPELYNRILDEQDAEDLVKGLVEFVKNVAKVEKQNKIILDVHSNLRVYLKYYYYLGFRTTDRKCIDNPFWIECEMNLLE